MKILKVTFISILAVVLLLSWIGLRDAESANLWPNKQGERSWITNTGATIKLAIVKTYKGHYIVHGTITEYDGYVRCLNGNAEIVGGNVIMHGSTSGIWGDELIGSIGMVNTMLMSVFERTRELAILRAIGWRKWTVMRLILLESLLLGLAGAVVGTLAFRRWRPE